MEEQLYLIGDAGKGGRREAFRKMLELGLDLLYPALERAIRDDRDADLRNAAMEVMVAFGEQAFGRLCELLTDGNEEVRNFATVMLGQIGSQAAVEPLVEALKDPDTNVRCGAAEALGRIGDRRALQPLGALVEGGAWESFHAACAIACIEREVASPLFQEGCALERSV
jgi:HEAT repeat protein